MDEERPRYMAGCPHETHVSARRPQHLAGYRPAGLAQERPPTGSHRGSLARHIGAEALLRVRSAWCEACGCGRSAPPGPPLLFRRKERATSESSLISTASRRPAASAGFANDEQRVITDRRGASRASGQHAELIEPSRLARSLAAHEHHRKTRENPLANSLRGTAPVTPQRRSGCCVKLLESAGAKRRSSEAITTVSKRSSARSLLAYRR